MALDKADLVLHEGVVFGHPESDSVAILDGSILAHGKFAELKSMVGPRTHLLKMAGRTVVPGFIDSHLHLWKRRRPRPVSRSGSIAPSMICSPSCASPLARAPPGNWLRAFGCDDSLLLDGRGPTREELDQAVPKNPLRLRHSTLHGSWLNSRAHQCRSESRSPNFKSPDGAVVVKDATGRATGLVVGMEEWITSKLPLVTAAETEARARIFSRELASSGVTAFTDASPRNDAAQVEVFGKLVGLALDMPARRRDDRWDATEHDARGIGREPRRRHRNRRGQVYSARRSMRPTRSRARSAMRLRSGLDCAFHATEVEELDAALNAIESAAQGISVPSRPSASRFVSSMAA